MTILHFSFGFIFRVSAQGQQQLHPQHVLGHSCAARRRLMLSLQRRFCSVSSGHVLPPSLGGSRPWAAFYFTNMQHMPSRHLQGHESVITASAADIEQHQLQRQCFSSETSLLQSAPSSSSEAFNNHDRKCLCSSCIRQRTCALTFASNSFSIATVKSASSLRSYSTTAAHRQHSAPAAAASVQQHKERQRFNKSLQLSATWARP